MSSHIIAPKHSTSSENGQLTAFYIISAFFCTGAISALAFESPLLIDAFCTKTELSNVFAAVLLYLSFHFAAFFLSSSYWGCFLLPFVSAAFGFFYYHMAEALMGLSPSLEAMLRFAALLLLAPCFFAVAIDAFGASLRLRALLSCCSIKTDRSRMLRLLLCFPAAALAAVVLIFY